MAKKHGALPPNRLKWQFGKTAASIKFVEDTRIFIKTCRSATKKAILNDAIEKIKSGELRLTNFTSPQEYLEQRDQTTKAKMVMHHDDPPCTARLNKDSNSCPLCNLVPDTQSTCIYYYCPTCDCPLKKLQCPNCKQMFKYPDR